MSQLEVDKIIPQSGTTLTIGDSGDTISFAEGTNLGIDTNTLVIDSTNNRVGIKNASPTVELDVTGSVVVSGTVTATSFSGDGSSLTGITSVGGATGVDFNDNVKARFGTGNDLEIYHDGTHSYISDQGTGKLKIFATDLEINNAGNTANYIEAFDGGAVKLYHNNALKLETTTTGADVRTTISGAESKLRVSSNNVTGDNDATVVISNSGTGDAMLRFDYEETNTDRARIGVTGSGQALKFYTGGNNQRMVIDNTGNVGIGVGTPTDYNSGFDNLVLGGTTGNHGATIVSATTGEGTVGFADGTTGTDEYRGFIQYQHSSDRFLFGVQGSSRIFFEGAGHITPVTSNAQDLGSSSLVWRNIYTSDFHMSNEGLDKGNDIDGTKGSWTFQEGEENLYLINNKNGKKYKFNLTEIE